MSDRVEQSTASYWEGQIDPRSVFQFHIWSDIHKSKVKTYAQQTTSDAFA